MGKERALLVGVDLGTKDKWSMSDSMTELAELAKNAGAVVVKQAIAKRKAPTSALYVGSGKAEELAWVCAQERIHVAMFNNDLSPAQMRNLERTLKVKVIDRTELILDIFAQRARTKEAKLQIELSQLQYLFPRLVRQWTHLSRQEGGIGVRGPGETQLEVDRRRIRSRIGRIKDQLETVRKQRHVQRKKRLASRAPTVALIGYTNSGKSTLLNQLTDAGTYVADKLFATLDPLTKVCQIDKSNKLIVSDTVGFIHDLPHHLVESFKATLEEVKYVDILVHVVDGADPSHAEKTEAVYQVLDELEVDRSNMITAINKIDLIDVPEAVEQMKRQYPNSVALSALTGERAEDLLTRVMQCCGALRRIVQLFFDQQHMDLVHQVYKVGHVIETKYTPGGVYLEVELTPQTLWQFEKFVIPSSSG